MKTSRERKRISEEEFRERLRDACAAAGGVKAFAEQNELAPSTVYDTLQGLEPRPKILASMRCRRVRSEYEEVPEGEVCRELTRGERWRRKKAQRK